MPIERPYETFYLLAIAMFVLFFAVCEIIRNKLPNIFVSNISPLKLTSRKDVEDLDEN